MSYSVATIFGLSTFTLIILELARNLNYEADDLRIANLNLVIRGVLMNIVAIMSYVILAVTRVIIQTEAGTTHGALKIIDMIMLADMFFVGFIFLLSAYMTILGVFINKEIAKKKKDSEWGDD